MKYLIVEGITDVQFIKYICIKNNIMEKFDDFEKQKNSHSRIDVYKYKNLNIININGQDSLKYTLENILFPMMEKIDNISIIQDADDNFELSKGKILKNIEDSKINPSKINYFLTPNNKENGDLETLLLSTLKKNNIIECFDLYAKCLLKKQEIYPKALKKGQVYAYTMYSQKGQNLHKPQDSFMYKKSNEYIDTNLWNLTNKNLEPIINFVINTFK